MAYQDGMTCSRVGGKMMEDEGMKPPEGRKEVMQD